MNFLMVDIRPVWFFCMFLRPLPRDGFTWQCFRLPFTERPCCLIFGCWEALRGLSFIMLHRHIKKSNKQGKHYIRSISLIGVNHNLKFEWCHKYKRIWQSYHTSNWTDNFNDSLCATWRIYKESAFIWWPWLFIWVLLMQQMNGVYLWVFTFKARYTTCSVIYPLIQAHRGSGLSTMSESIPQTLTDFDTTTLFAELHHEWQLRVGGVRL